MDIYPCGNPHLMRSVYSKLRSSKTVMRPQIFVWVHNFIAVSAPSLAGGGGVLERP